MSLRCHYFQLAAALAVVAALRCTWDAPRDNPLDPALGGNISGRVLTRRASPIAGAELSLPAAGRFATTDSTGSFELRGLPDESTLVLIAADGYAADSTVIGLTKGVIDTVTAYLNGLPYLAGCRITAHVHGRGWPPDPLQFCTLAATAGDGDGEADVDSVWVEIPAINCSRKLPYNSDETLYVQALWAEDLPGQALDTLVGQEVRFNVVDKESTTATYTLSGVSRIITDLPEPVFPSGGTDTLAGDTLFSWRRFDHGYGVHYHGEVVRIQGGSPAGIAAEFNTADTTWLFAWAQLQSGDYYWTIEAIDGFGNSSRSAEELFHAR